MSVCLSLCLSVLEFRNSIFLLQLEQFYPIYIFFGDPALIIYNLQAGEEANDLILARFEETLRFFGHVYAATVDPAQMCSLYTYEYVQTMRCELHIELWSLSIQQ